MKILRQIADEKSSMENISKTIERDPSLAANILKVSNSPYYGVRQKVASLKLALTILGLNEVINMVTSISIIRMFPSRRKAGEFNRSKFWRHSFGCALAAQMLATEMRFSTEGVEFVAGLIHDIGKLILDQYFHPKLKEIWSLKEKEDVPLLEAETRVMGVDHAVLGSWLAQSWQLPPVLVDSIMYHHRPLDVLALSTPSPMPSLTAIVHLADILACEPELNFTESMTSPQSFTENTAWKIILAERPALDKPTLERFIGKYDEHREKVSALIEAVS